MKTRQEAQQRIEEKRSSGAHVISEDEAKVLFSCYGIPVVTEKRVKGIEQAVAAAAACGFPLALKGLDPRFSTRQNRGWSAWGLALKNR